MLFPLLLRSGRKWQIQDAFSFPNGTLTIKFVDALHVKGLVKLKSQLTRSDECCRACQKVCVWQISKLWKSSWADIDHSYSSWVKIPPIREKVMFFALIFTKIYTLKCSHQKIKIRVWKYLWKKQHGIILFWKQRSSYNEIIEGPSGLRHYWWRSLEHMTFQVTLCI